jgi:hypothetical protein
MSITLTIYPIIYINSYNYNKNVLIGHISYESCAAWAQVY